MEAEAMELKDGEGLGEGYSHGLATVYPEMTKNIT